MVPLRQKIEQAVYAMLEEIGLPAGEAVADAKLLEIMLDEDVTYWFVPGVERRLGVEIPLTEWEFVVTVGDSIATLERHLAITSPAHPVGP